MSYENVTTAESGTIVGTSTWSQLINLNPLENHITLTSEDNYGNTRVYNFMVGRDNSPPSLSIVTPTSAATFYNNIAGALTITGLSSDVGGGIVSLTWSNALTSQSGSIPIANSWTASNIPVIEGINPITITATDAAGNITTRSLDYELNLSSPIITQGTFSINGGAETTTNRLVQVDLEATDYNTTITHLCLKLFDPAPPDATDPCFSAIPAAQNLTLTNFPYTIGSLSLNYRLIAYIKNSNNHVSVLSNQKQGEVGTDIAFIDLQLSTPPEIKGVLATNTNTPSAPVLETELDTATTPIIIKWHAIDNDGLAANPIDLSWTTDFITFTTIASNLPNSATGTCTPDHAGSTLDDGFTGCYEWTAGVPATGTLFFVRVVARDLDGQTAVSNSLPMNTTNFNLIGGRLDTGLNTHASALKVNYYNDFARNLFYWFQSNGSFAINSKGEFFLIDSRLGIVKVVPSTGQSSLILRKDFALASNNGDGGTIASATVKNPINIEIGPNDNIYIMDHDRIRVINYQTEIISTIAGGGAVTTDTVADPLTLRIGPFSEHYISAHQVKNTFTVSSNGDIYFNTGYYMWYTLTTSYSIRKYNASTGGIETFRPTGTGTLSNADQNISVCRLVGAALNFDDDGELSDIFYKTYPAGGCLESTIRVNVDDFTSTAPHPVDYNNLASRYGNYYTGKDGKIYGYSHYSRRIDVYNPAGNLWTNLLQGSLYMPCAEGSNATACNNDITSMYVTADSNIYFLDAKVGIRRIDAEGKVRTVIGFYRLNQQDDRLGHSSLIGVPNSIDMWKDGTQWKVSALDGYNHRFVEFNPAGKMVHLAGNGATGGTALAPALAKNTYVYTYYGGSILNPHVQNRATGDIYHNYNSISVASLSRSTLQWSKIIGAGGTFAIDPAADGLIGNDIKFHAYGPRTLGINPTNDELLVYHWNSTGARPAVTKIFDVTDSFRQSTFTNSTVGASVNTWCANGTPVSECRLPYYIVQGRAHYDTEDNAWIYPYPNYSAVHVLPVGGNKATITLNNTLLAADSKHNAFDHVIYYCAVNGNLYQRDVGSGIETQISYPFPDMVCRGHSILYNSERDSLIFGFEYRGMGGVGEVML